MLLWWGCVGANVWKLNGRRWVVSLSDPKASIITGREKFCDLQQLVKILKMSEKCHSQKCFLWLLLKLSHDEGVWVQKSNGSRWVVCLFDPKASIIYSLVWPSKTFQNLQNVNKCHLSPWECVGENVSNGWRWVTRLVSCDLHCRKLFIILNISSEYTLEP